MEAISIELEPAEAAAVIAGLLLLRGRYGGPPAPGPVVARVRTGDGEFVALDAAEVGELVERVAIEAGVAGLDAG